MSLSPSRFHRDILEKGLNLISHTYWLVRTQLLYSWQFESLGSRSIIRKPMLLTGKQFMRFGSRVHIRNAARIEVLQTSANRTPLLEIGDDTNIEQNVHLICHSHVRIGNGVSITGKCSIVDLTHPYEDVESPEKIGSRIRDEESFVEIGDGSFLGYGAVVLPNVRIGRHCIIGANSVVSRDVPDYTVAAGVPARLIRRYDFCSGTWLSVEKDRVGRTSNT